ncbi:hypothetical protein GCM10008940_15400 [Microbulbifer agarilyticus]
MYPTVIRQILRFSEHCRQKERGFTYLRNAERACYLLLADQQVDLKGAYPHSPKPTPYVIDTSKKSPPAGEVPTRNYTENIPS